MALPLQNTAEGQATTTTVSTANSGGVTGDAFDAVVIGTNMTETFDNTHPGTGLNGYKIALTSTATAATYVEWSSFTVTQIWGRFYYWCSIIPVSTIRILDFYNGATRIAMLGVASGTNAFQWRTSADAGVGVVGTAFSVSTLMRFEFTVTFSATVGAATGKTYTGQSLTPLATDATTSAQNFGVQCTKVRFGATTANFSSTSGNAFWIDDLALNATGFPGPGPGRVSELVTAPYIPT